MSFKVEIGELGWYGKVIFGGSVVGALYNGGNRAHKELKASQTCSLAEKIFNVTRSATWGIIEGASVGAVTGAFFPLPIILTANHYSSPANRERDLKWVQTQVESVCNKFK